MIAIIDYGMGNLRSVSKALEKVGAEVKVTSDVSVISRADAVVLPGVGAFHRAMENLIKLNIPEFLRKSIAEGVPFLGICLGLQLLFTESEEGHGCPGLNLIAGRVKRFKGNVKVPHMGWNQISLTRDSPVLSGIPDSSFMYFAHSYYVEPEDKEVVVAAVDYGMELTASVRKNNIFAVQFHPEKSGELGLKILKNFCQLRKC
jgi:glutamine amidotransferase